MVESPMKKNRAYVVLSTQRSGSTLLCKDMTSTLVMGSPDEHLLKYLNNKIEFNVDDLMASCNDEYDNFGIKLMSNYLDDASKLFLSECDFEYNDESSPFANLIGFLSSKYDSVQVIYLTRDDYFEQALSRLTAIKTNTWHSVNGSIQRNDGKFISDSNSAQLRSEIIDSIKCKELTQGICDIVNENKKLEHEFDSIEADNVYKYKTNYNEVVFNSEALLTKIFGQKVTVNRTLSKISNEADTIRAKVNYFNSLRELTNDKAIDTLRDASVLLQDANEQVALKLMELAYMLRPEGQFIEKNYWS